MDTIAIILEQFLYVMGMLYCVKETKGLAQWSGVCFGKC